MSGFTFLQQKTFDPGGSWHCKVEVHGLHYWVSLRRGNRRGKFYGNVAYEWRATVRDAQREVYKATFFYMGVPVKKILTQAGLLEEA